MILLDVFEVVVRTYLQLGAGGLVANDDALRMELQGRDGPHLIDSALNSLLQSTCLVVAIHHDQYLLRIEHRAYTHRNGCLRHLVHVVVEETRVGDDRVCRQRLHACARAEGRTRLVEGDMSVRTDATEKQMGSDRRYNIIDLMGIISSRWKNKIK